MVFAGPLPRTILTFAMKVFISYRRGDSIVHARLIHQELATRFGADDVFMDIDDIDYGDDFARRIDERLASADVVVALIGPQWSALLQQRLHGDDYVRYELARSLALGKRIVPVFVGGASPPGAELPPDLAGLRTLNGLSLDERSLKPHLNALIEAVRGESFESETRERDRFRVARWIGAATGVAMSFAALSALLDVVGLDTRLASATMRLAGWGQPPAWSGEVVVVGITPDTERRVGRPFDASWRREHAQLIERIAAAGARTIAFDLFIERPAAAAEDAALEAAIRAARATPVVFAAQRSVGDRLALLPRLAGVASAGISCGGLKLDHARAMPLAVQRGASFFPSLALAAFSGGGRIESLDEYRQALRVRVVHDDRSPDVGFSSAETVRSAETGCEAIQRGDRVLLQWLVPSRVPSLASPPRRLAYEQVFEGGDATALKGRIVLVGLQMPGRDVFSVPGAGDRFGVELVAAQLDSLLRGEAVRPMRFGGTLAAMLLIGVAAASAARRMRAHAAWVRGAIIVAGVIACIAATVIVYRDSHVLLNLPCAVLAFVLSWWAVRWFEKRGVR
jgi:CHASE2 domain-containing sensor protein